MKLKKQLAKSLVLPLVVLGSVLNLNLSSRAESQSRFYCGEDRGRLATIVEHPKLGKLTIIVWESDFFIQAGYSPRERCHQVSGRFQLNNNEGRLKYIIGSRLHNQPVLCAALRAEYTGCSDKTLLFTLRPYDNPDEMIRQLNELAKPPEQEGLRRQPVYHSGSLIELGNGRYAIDVNQLILNSPATQEFDECFFGSCQ